MLRQKSQKRRFPEFPTVPLTQSTFHLGHCDMNDPHTAATRILQSICPLLHHRNSPTLHAHTGPPKQELPPDNSLNAVPLMTKAIAVGGNNLSTPNCPPSSHGCLQKAVSVKGRSRSHQLHSLWPRSKPEQNRRTEQQKHVPHHRWHHQTPHTDNHTLNRRLSKTLFQHTNTPDTHMPRCIGASVPYAFCRCFIPFQAICCYTSPLR
jgi:hypothetical protein